MQLKYILLVISLFIVGCMGGGGGRYNPPRIVINKINIKKEEVKTSQLNIEKEKIVFRTTLRPIKGFLKSTNQKVVITKKPGYPKSKLFCRTLDNKLLWSFDSERSPFNSLVGVYFDQSNKTTEIYMIWGNTKQFICVYNESGKEIKKIKLDSQYYRNLTVFTFLHTKYIAVEDNGQNIIVLDLNGNVIKRLHLPRYPVSTYLQAIQDSRGNDYVVLWVDQQSTSHSSTFFILSSGWKIVYKEYLLGACWAGVPPSNPKKYVVIAPERSWRPHGEWEMVGGPWKYVLP